MITQHSEPILSEEEWLRQQLAAAPPLSAERRRNLRTLRRNARERALTLSMHDCQPDHRRGPAPDEQGSS